MSLKSLCRVLCLSVSAALLLIPLWGAVRAQSSANAGQLVGQVLDTSGASIPGAELVVRNEETNFTRTVTTDDAGRYAATHLPLGQYEITVRAAGFANSSQRPVVTLASSISCNFTLTVGGTNESVHVT